MRNKCLLLKPPRPWYFVMAAWAKTPGLYFTGPAGAVLRLNWQGQVEATALVQAREDVGLALSGSGESNSNGRNLLMQTDPFKSSNWGSVEYIPVIPLHGFLTVYFFQGPTDWECFFFLSTEWFRQVLLFLNQTCVAVPRNGDFSHHSSKLHLVQKTSFICFQKLIWVLAFYLRCDLCKLWFCNCSSTTGCLWNVTSERGWVCFIAALPAQIQTENVAVMFCVRFILQSLPSLAWWS